MDTWKKVAIGAAAVVVVVGGTRAAGLWGGSSSGNSKNLSFQLPTPIQTLDISKNTDTYSGAIIGNSGSNLMRVDSKGKAQLELAKSVKVSDDGLKYTVVLKNGLKWSDGSKLTAQDFVYSWQRIVDPKTASQYAYLASGVKNADKIAAGKADVDTLGVTAKGNTITFDLERPLPQFEYLLTFSNFMPQKQSFVTKEGKKYATTAATSLYSGPYKVEGWNGTNNSFKLIKNDNYWDAKNIKTKQIDVQVVQKPETAVQLYKQGKIDRVLISGTPELYKANKNDKNVSKAPEATTAYLQYNQTGKNKFLANAKIREALNLATNRKELTDQVTAGISTPATGLAPEGLAKTASGEDLAKFVAPGYKFDPKKAATLFQEGLKEVGESQATITVTSDADSPAAKSTLDYLQGSWEKALPGLKINQKFVPFSQRIKDSQTQNFDIVVSLWGGDYPEGSTYYDIFKTDASNNNGQFKNEAYDALVNKAESTDALKASARDNDYKMAEAALLKDSNFNPLYFRAGYALQNPKVTGIVLNSTGLNQDWKLAVKK
ncbi:peptide ABC transporter substrate-binding protein [Leuconostoc gelidum]|uniref:peptide ABC transporter substrate-binding protein n=1 Tax=Leuconostoc gelidum TaxID=1244 RepID=UPI00021939AB|nr:peptide ABC transporter substrate-binding protein [Leuconostoc gelidum]MBZ5991377.1 peptide ABC transporter substrate-binding protein [Leuconostoc gelidum subsp. gelidum]USP17168.1 peptide ABC transporter substrate-binding protein [Leuconostoc gelidum subsp. aenigmaticum]GMA67063.1 peptide ABC transporter substrate-binding protein [Leuconostoc gelidum subsp. gelidum]